MQRFERDSVKRWRRAVHKELRWLNLPSEDDVYRAAMICAAIYCFGTDVSVLIEISGQDEARVRAVLKRLRKTGVLSGQRLRASDGWSGKHGTFGLLLDAMVAAGELYRPPDKKRSAAAKARPRTKSSSPRRPPTKIEPGSVFSPKVSKSNPFYGLAEWETKGTDGR